MKSYGIMKKLILVVFLGLNSFMISAQENVIELGPSESMSITGKGPGQDAAINPYIDGNSIARVQNLSKNPFSIRVQKRGEILRTMEVKSKQTLEVKLEKGNELYFDSVLPSKARVEFFKD